METESMLWITGICGFLAGLIPGAILYHLVRRGRYTNPHTQTRLASLDREVTVYRDQVARHLETSTELFDRLTDSWRELQSHLASGTRTLCAPEPTSVKDDSQPAALSEPPRDYAPRNGCDEGTLSEGFRVAKAAGHKETDQGSTASGKA